MGGSKGGRIAPLVSDDTAETDANYIELVLLSNLVADYSEEHYSVGEPSLIDVMKLRMFEWDLLRLHLLG